MKYIITISRTYGSGGKEIGKALAEALGIKYYGREFLKPQIENDFDDDESVRLSLSLKGDEIDFETEDKKYDFQSKMIADLAKTESCVFVGRCADYVLRDMDNLIKIYIHARPRYCLRRVMRLFELNPDDAKSLIYSMNKSRGEYYKYHTKQDRDNAANYDLCLDISDFSTEESVDFLKDFIERKLKSLE